MKTFLRYLEAIFNVTKRVVCNETVLLFLAIIGSFSIAEGLSSRTAWVVDTMAVVFCLMAFVGVIGICLLIWDAIHNEAERLKDERSRN